jgi:predicted transposase YdaD
VRQRQEDFEFKTNLSYTASFRRLVCEYVVRSCLERKEGRKEGREGGREEGTKGKEKRDKRKKYVRNYKEFYH